MQRRIERVAPTGATRTRGSNYLSWRLHRPWPGIASGDRLPSEIEKDGSPVFLRGNHEVMVLDARNDSTKANLWQSYGGSETLGSYGVNYNNYGPDWVQAIPAAHWEFLEHTARFFENDTHIFVHACLDPELDMDAQPDWLLFWEYFDRLQPHRTGKQIISGHTPQRSGQIKAVGFATCIDTAPASGGWLTCLDVDSGKYWQANENGSVRDGVLR